MKIKNILIMLAVAAITVTLFPVNTTAYDPLEEVEFEEVTPATRVAIRRGLEFLADNQDEDGAWKDIIGRKESNTYKGHYDKHVGATALAIMAFISNGHFPGRGQYGDNVERGIDWLCEHVDSKGFVSFSGSRMYSHAFATLALAEVYGMSQRQDLGDKLRKAVKIIVAAQNAQGAWRYKPGAPDSDLSITVCQVMALRSARNAGIHVDRKVINNAITYVKNSYTKNGYQYQCYESSTRTSFALTAAGVVALQGAGEYDCLEVKKGIQHMFENRANDPQISPERFRRYGNFDYFYAHYYAVQAMFQAGGEYWSAWYPMVREHLLRHQRMFSDGRWEDLVGPNYATAMATIILQMPYRYLPIFER